MRISILTLLLALVTTLSFGQENTTYKSSLIKLMRISGAEVAYLGVLDQVVESYKGKTSNVPKEYWGEFMIEFRTDAFNHLINSMLPVYQKHLTEADINGVIAFYLTPAGKKYAEKTPFITQETMELTLQWGKEINDKIIDKLKEKGYL